MKKIQFLFSLILLSSSAISQNTFFKWYPSDKHDYIYTALETSDGNYILCGEQYEDVSTNSQGYLLKLNQNGDLLQIGLYEASDTTSSHALIYTLPNEEDIFNTVTNQIIMNNGHNIHIQSFNKFNSNLEIISCKKFVSPLDKQVLPQAVLILSDTMIIIQSEFTTYLPYFHIIASSVTKYNLQVDSLASFYKTGNYLFSFGLIADTITKTIKSFSVNPGTYTYASKLNYEMQLLGETKLPFFISSTSSTKFSDTKYLLTGTVMDIMYVKQHIKVRSYDQNDLPIDSVAYYNHPDTILYSGAVCNTAIVELNPTFVG